MADQQLAVQLAEQGGIGLARMMVEQMQTRGLVTQAPDAEAPMNTGVSTNALAEPDVTKAFGLAVANAYELRSGN
jgi:Rod binding domain-containing protein